MVTLPVGSTVADLRKSLCKVCPALQPLISGLLIAVNAQYASDAAWLTPDADVACFPPVSGG
jgi:molybdopterin converting factor small subunit